MQIQISFRTEELGTLPRAKASPWMPWLKALIPSLTCLFSSTKAACRLSSAALIIFLPSILSTAVNCLLQLQLLFSPPLCALGFPQGCVVQSPWDTVIQDT